MRAHPPVYSLKWNRPVAKGRRVGAAERWPMRRQEQRNNRDMSEIRGEKVKFGRDDIVCLHELPSARAHEPIVLHCTERPGHLSPCLLRLLVGLAAGRPDPGADCRNIESGLVDAPLNARALQP